MKCRVVGWRPSDPHWLVARFRHRAPRAGDPQLHTQMLVPVQCMDGGETGGSATAHPLEAGHGENVIYGRTIGSNANEALHISRDVTDRL